MDTTQSNFLQNSLKSLVDVENFTQSKQVAGSASCLISVNLTEIFRGQDPLPVKNWMMSFKETPEKKSPLLTSLS